MYRPSQLNHTSRTIIFDSGVGGLSILEEVRHHIPSAELIFACDNAAFPYGILSETRLIERVCKVMDRLITELKPDIVVIACNTASTIVLDELRREFHTTFVGVVPAIKPAASASNSKVIGLLATPGTIERSYTDSLISDFASDCEILRVGSSELVQIAEQKLRGIPPESAVIERILEPFRANSSLDSIVLACTHFPLLAEELKAAMPEHVQWIDSGTAIARRILSIIESKSAGLKTDNFEERAAVTEPHVQQAKHRAFMTAEDSNIKSLNTRNATYGLGAFELLQL